MKNTKTLGTTELLEKLRAQIRTDETMLEATKMTLSLCRYLVIDAEYRAFCLDVEDGVIKTKMINYDFPALFTHETARKLANVADVVRRSTVGAHRVRLDVMLDADFYRWRVGHLKAMCNLLEAAQTEPVIKDLNPILN